MKLVAAAKVRRAQAAVIDGRPFAENLVKVRYMLGWRGFPSCMPHPHTHSTYYLV